MSAPPYESMTRSTRLADLPVAVRNAVVTLAEQQKLQLANAQVWVTLRKTAPAKSVLRTLLRRPKAPGPVHEMVLVVHATHFVVGGSRGVVADAVARTVPLTEASIVPSAPGTEKGFTIHGFSGASPTFFMALGNGADADACLAAATKAIADAPAAAKALAEANEATADAKAATKAKDASADAAKAAAKLAEAAKPPTA